MIIKGGSRTGPAALAAHLGNAEKNERVSLLETRGTVSRDLRGALVEMDAYALGTRCTKPLYHAAISPAPPHRLSPEQREEAIDALEAKLGLTGHARVVVMHEKFGREHIHIVWSRIDTQKMRTVSDSHNFRKHEEVARDLERRFGHDRVQGAHHERDGVDRPSRTPSRAELRQEERTGIKGKNVRQAVTEVFRASDNAEAFKAALEDLGYILAKGDRRDFVVVDRAGGIHSLARRIDGMKAAELREFMAPIDREALPDTDRARVMMTERERRTSEARDDAKTEKSYGRGDYVSQSTAALKEHSNRLDALDPKRKQERRKALKERFARADREAGGTDHSHDAGPHPQDKAPGGGHTRSR
ncbi:MAG TPA: relaxase/mobilization nuclease domain-containing protein [Rhizomicrobium sp.]